MHLPKRMVPFFVLCLGALGIGVLLSYSVQPPQRTPPWGRGLLIYASTHQTVQSDQNPSTQSPLINSTVLVQDSSPDELTLLIIVGNFLGRADSDRLLGYDRNSELTLDGALILKVTANKNTGSILSAAVSNEFDTSRTALGLQLARQILINQEKSAYSTPNLKVKEDGREECSYPDVIDGTTFCPEFTRTRTETSLIYTKSYSTASLLGKKHGDSFNSDTVMSTQINAETGLLEAATSKGWFTMEMFRVGTNSTMTTVYRSSVTSFQVQFDTFLSPTSTGLNALFSNIAFQPLNLSSRSDVPFISSARQLDARVLNSPNTNSGTYMMLSILGTPVYLQYAMTFNPNSTQITASFQVGSTSWITFIDQSYFNDMLPLVRKVIVLRNTTKSNMEAMLSLNDNLLMQLQTDLKGLVSDTLNKVESVTDAINTKVHFIVNKVKKNFNDYKSQMVQVVDSKVKRLKKTVTTGKQEIDQIMVTASKSDQATLIAPIQASINSAQNLLENIAHSTYSWQGDFEQNGLTTIDPVFQPFYSLNNTVIQAIPQISTTIYNMQSSMNSTFAQFNNTMSVYADTVRNAFINVDSNQATQISSDPDIFDFSFLDTMISSVKADLSAVSTNSNELRDFLLEKTISLVANVTNLFNQTLWTMEFNTVNTRLLALQSQYHYSLPAATLTEKWIIETMNSLRKDVLAELSLMDIVDLASSMSTVLTYPILDGLVAVSLDKDTLVQTFLAQAVKAQTTTPLLTLPPQTVSLNSVSTPYGTHYPRASLTFQSSLSTSVILDGNQFVGTVDPTLTISISNIYNFLNTDGITGAKANVEIGVNVTADLLCQVGAYRTPATVMFNTSLNYQVTGKDSLFCQKEAVTYHPSESYKCSCKWYKPKNKCKTCWTDAYSTTNYGTAVTYASDTFDTNTSVHLVEESLALSSR